MQWVRMMRQLMAPLILAPRLLTVLAVELPSFRLKRGQRAASSCVSCLDFRHAQCLLTRVDTCTLTLTFTQT
jgi:hypothetical protein